MKLEASSQKPPKKGREVHPARARSKPPSAVLVHAHAQPKKQKVEDIEGAGCWPSSAPALPTEASGLASHSSTMLRFSIMLISSMVAGSMKLRQVEPLEAPVFGQGGAQRF